MRVALLSDTHAPRFWKACPAPVSRALDGVDAILHAGDVCVPEVLAELAAYAPVYSVKGNNDRFAGPETLELTLDGLAIAMIHDSGPSRGRGARLHALFPTAGVVVFGHSHIPWDETHNGQRHLNPGSPTDKRRQPRPTMGELTIADGTLLDARIFPVD